MTTIYVDNPPPRYIDQARDLMKAMPGQTKVYLKDLFPIVHWLPKYNLVWFTGDLTAAITVGTLVIPQSLAYGKKIIITSSILTLTLPFFLFLTI